MENAAARFKTRRNSWEPDIRVRIDGGGGAGGGCGSNGAGGADLLLVAVAAGSDAVPAASVEADPLA